ncbi:hypothetical protein [Streptomyces johnsoniae]|uniref:Secreted protein n=1 Tax=Streptomyces johnsoniae TaxID=3075532 RepID=A0ABU2SGC4_9ACTN|nr:hypothetical protein [Streptomyces sp. DSM 41886]MDT0446820.1 hypothetical protein [Streptomyces sp. DSM 41886]
MNGLPLTPTTATAAALLALAGICAVAFLRGHLAHRPNAATRPATPHAGFATPDDLTNHLSETAVRRAGTQVRPSLTPGPEGTTPR